MHSTLRPLALLLLATAVACGERPAADSTDNVATDSPPLPARDLTALAEASSWRGEIPCADCAGVRTVVTLYPDGTYRSQGAYLGTNGGGDTIFTDLGRWTHESDGTRLRLRGAANVPGRFAVTTDGALRMLDTDGNDIASDGNYTLRAVAPAVTVVHPARLTGAFTYMADAAIFVECESGLRHPVDMSAEFPALQRAYADAGGSGQPIVVRVKAHLDNRPAMEGTGTERALVVDSVSAINPDDGCAALRVQDAVAAGEWRLVDLESEDAGAMYVADDSEASFRLERGESRISGSGGCNQFSGGGIMRGTTLVGGPVGGTKRFCNAPGVMDIEQRFFDVMARDKSLRIDGDTLVWSNGPQDIARFVRQ